MIIQNIVAIFQKEFQGYFKSSLAYIVAGIFWLIAGTFMVNILLGEQGIIQEVAYGEQLGIPLPPIDVSITSSTSPTVRPYFATSLRSISKSRK